MHEDDKKNAVQRGNFDPNTVFTKILTGELPAEILFQNDLVTAFMDIQPITAGHVLVIPNERAASLSELPIITGAEIFKVGQSVAAAIRKSNLHCEGINLFLADGVAAGQTVFHYHVHLIPSSIHELGRHAVTQADNNDLANIAQKLAAVIDA